MFGHYSTVCVEVSKCRLGSYIFLEVSSPVKRGDVAILKSQQFNSVGGKTRCLNFWYHMYGADIGTLQVIYKVFSGSQTEKVIWNLTGQQQISESDPWKYARVPVDMNSDHMVSLLIGTAWKASRYGVFLVRIFPHSDWIWRDTEHLSVFSPNAGKYGPEKTPYLDSFHIMRASRNLEIRLLLCWVGRV